MGFEGHDDNDDDDDLNTDTKGKQKVSAARSGDGGYGAARSAEAQENAARDREALDAQIALGQAVPDVNSNYDALEMNTQGEFRLKGQKTVNPYRQPGDPWEDGEDGLLNTAQAASSTNAAEAGIVEPEVAEVHRSEQGSRRSESSEVDEAKTLADKKREMEAKARRRNKIAAAVGIPAALVVILVPTLLKVFGVIGGGGSGGGTTTGGGGTKGDKAGPLVKDVAKPGLNPNKPYTLDVPAEILQANDPSVDKASVELTSSDEGDKTRLTVPMAGQFKLDPATGALTFNPVAYFRGGPAEAGVTIANASKARSARSKITLTFDTPPLVLDQIIKADLTQTNTVTFNVLTGKGVTMGGAAVKGTHAIRDNSVVFRVPMPLEGGDPQQGTITITGGKTAVADGEGKWDIAQDGTITFTRQPGDPSKPNDNGFTGNPTPLTYSVFDAQGIESNVGKLIITSFLDEVTKAVTLLNGSDDTVFWANYRKEVINGSYGALDDPSEIVGKLTLFRTVHLVITEITRQSLSTADRKTVSDALPLPGVITTAYTAWAKAGFDLDTALTQAENLTPAGNPADSIVRGTRLLRLNIISRLIGRWQDAIDKAMQTTTTPGGN